MQLILLVVVFGLLIIALGLLSVDRTIKKRPLRPAEPAPERAPNAGETSLPATMGQRRARRRRARMNAATRNGPPPGRNPLKDDRFRP